MSGFGCSKRKTSDIIKAARNDAIRTLHLPNPPLTPLGEAFRARYIELGEVVPCSLAGIED